MPRLTAAVLLASFALVSTAHAASVHATTGESGAFGVAAGTVHYSAVPGEANRVTATLIAGSRGVVELRDDGADIDPGARCTREGPHVVRCDTAADFVNVMADVGDANDEVAIGAGIYGYVLGGNGDDVLTGGCQLVGDAGNDTLTGCDDISAALNHTLRAGPGDDVVLGGNASEIIDGGGGDDALSGGAGDDAITDGDGVTGDPGGDLIDGGPGERDSVSYAQRTGAVRIDLAQPDGLQGAAGDADKLVNVENVSTGSGNDVLRGDGVRNRLDGGDGADTVDGRDGDDLLLDGAGPDVVNGGPGNDEIVARDLYRDVVSCGAGRDQALVDIGDVIGGCEGTTRTVVDLIPGRYRLGVRDRRTSIRPACPDLDELPRTVAREFESCSFRVVLKLPVGGRMVVAGQTQCGLKGCKPLLVSASAWRMLSRKRSVVGRVEFFRLPPRGALTHAERVTVLRRRG